jgi:uroporphyrinogen-III decarboxylase
MLTGRERILASIRGKPVGKLPWTPRIDLWYRAHVRQGTLPAKWAAGSMWDIIREVGGLLYYPNVATWHERLWGLEIVETVDGRVSGAEQPFSRSFTGREAWDATRQWAQTTVTEYRTPRGTVRTKHVWTQDMALGGVQQPQPQEPIIKSVDDYPIVEYILEHTEYIPAYEALHELIAEFGDQGLAIGGAGWTPIHALMNEYIGYGQCFYHMYDHPEEFARLLQVVQESTWQAKKIAARSPAEIVMIGCNWTDSITSPPLFRKYFMPALEEAVDLMHGHGKLTTCHVDGHMKALLKLFAQTGVDVAEALAPAPLCNYTLAEARETLGSRMAIWGGIPTPLFTDVYGDRDFDDYVRGIFRTIAPGDHFILAMGDNVPPNGVFERVSRVTRLVQELGDLSVDPEGADSQGLADGTTP